MFYLSQERTHMRQQTSNPRSFHWKFYCRLRVLSFLALLPCCCLPRPLPDLLSPVPVAWCPLSLSFNKSTFRSKWKGSKWFIFSIFHYNYFTVNILSSASQLVTFKFCHHTARSPLLRIHEWIWSTTVQSIRGKGREARAAKSDTLDSFLQLKKEKDIIASLA